METRSSTTRYDAFISYSHQDSEFAQSLVYAMRGFFGFRRADALRIFLDSETLTAAPRLSEELEHNLEVSRHLVLLASPSSAASPWVQVELDWWISHSRLDRLIIVLTDGTITKLPDGGIDPRRVARRRRDDDRRDRGGAAAAADLGSDGADRDDDDVHRPGQHG